MYADEFYNKIVEICNKSNVKKSGRQAKWDLYRAIKTVGAEYQKLAEEERMKTGEFVSRDAMKIHIMLNMVTKDKFTDKMTFDEYKNLILRNVYFVLKNN